MANIHVKNADLRDEIMKCKETGVLSRKAIDMFYIMAEKFSHKLNYVYEEDRQDCISGAVIDCYLYWKGYDISKSANAFAYFTQVQKNGMGKAFRKIYGSFPMSCKVSISRNNIYTI
jgi:hypothetical protein